MKNLPNRSGLREIIPAHGAYIVIVQPGIASSGPIMYMCARVQVRLLTKKAVKSTKKKRAINKVQETQATAASSVQKRRRGGSPGNEDDAPHSEE
jgi:hypothetical protein